MNAPTLQELHDATGGQLKIGRPTAQEVAIGPIVIDSRQVTEGSVFWALRGPNHDAADFADEAFERGAAGVVAERSVEAPEDRWVLEVENTQRALWSWAAWRRRRFTGILVAVTGSVGKTTTRRDDSHAVLRHSVCNGTDQRRETTTTTSVFPLSMMAARGEPRLCRTRTGRQQPRARLRRWPGSARPNVGVITHVADAHLGSFGSLRGDCREPRPSC